MSSAQCVVFAPDHAAVARELARVCAGLAAGPGSPPGGRAITGPGQLALIAKYSPPSSAGPGMLLDSGRRDYVTGRLGDVFDLEFFDGESPQRGGSPKWLWKMFST